MAPKPLTPPILCLVTDRRRSLDAPLAETVALAVEGGVNMVQLREKDLPGGRLLALALEIRQAVGDRALLVVNERVDVALACRADGVHLGEEALDPATTRRITGDGLLIGRSVHSLRGAVEAHNRGCDYLIAGPVYATGSHPGAAPAGLGLVEEAAAAIPIPCLGIGGVNPQNAAAVIAGGGSGVAVISAILSSDRPKEAARDLWEAVKAAWESRPSSLKVASA